MRHSSRLKYLVAVTVVSILCSCREELCYDHTGSTAVTLDYEQEWERDYGMSHSASWDEEANGGTYDSHRPGLPESVAMTAYGSDDTKSSLHFLGAAGGETELPPGDYSLLLYNNDTEYIVINDEASLPDAAATTTTRSRSSLTPLHRGERTVSPPDVLYGAFTTQTAGSAPHSTSTISATMRPLVYTYIIRYKFDHGIEHVRLARGALAGMAEKVFLRSGATGAEAATVLFDCEVQPWGVLAKVKSFGVPSFPGDHYNRAEGEVDPDLTFTLNLEVMLPNGTIKSFERDITSQMRRQPRGGVIVVDGFIVVDEDAQVDSGFDVAVDDWGEYTDIDLMITDTPLFD